MTRDPCPSMAEASVVELRQYTLRPGCRETLVELFERELIEPQQAVGMRVGGVFCDRRDPDRFVWFRGFADLPARHRALTGFYSGPVWREHGSAANATMLDTDDVLLLRPTAPARPVADPAPPPADEREWVVVSVYEHLADEELTRWLTVDVQPLLEDALGVPVGAWRTEPARNTVPSLPVRDGANAFVWTATFADETHYRGAWAGLLARDDWRRLVAPRLTAALTAHQHLDLRPTPRSAHPALARRAAAAPATTERTRP
ncbi:MAG TPA: NIPSNAP family protein [Streptosporangiales bacterium]